MKPSLTTVSLPEHCQFVSFSDDTQYHKLEKMDSGVYEITRNIVIHADFWLIGIQLMNRTWCLCVTLFTKLVVSGRIWMYEGTVGVLG